MENYCKELRKVNYNMVAHREQCMALVDMACSEVVGDMACTAVVEGMVCILGMEGKVCILGMEGTVGIWVMDGSMYRIAGMADKGGMATAGTACSVVTVGMACNVESKAIVTTLERKVGKACRVGRAYRNISYMAYCMAVYHTKMDGKIIPCI